MRIPARPPNAPNAFITTNRGDETKRFDRMVTRTRVAATFAGVAKQ